MTLAASRAVNIAADSKPRPRLAPAMMMVLPVKGAVGGGTPVHFSRRKGRGFGFIVYDVLVEVELIGNDTRGI